MTLGGSLGILKPAVPHVEGTLAAISYESANSDSFSRPTLDVDDSNFGSGSLAIALWVLSQWTGTNSS